MSIAQALLAEFEQEVRTTRRFLECVPADALGWRPHEKSHTAGELAFHIAVVPGSVLTGALADEFQVPDFAKIFAQPPSTREIIEKLDWSVATVRVQLPTLDDARLHQALTIKRGADTLASMPRVAFLRSIMFNHWYHHRGQLGVYLRLMGAQVPAAYGPSGDEMPQ